MESDEKSEGFFTNITSFLERLKFKYRKVEISDESVIAVPWEINGLDFLVLIKEVSGHVVLRCGILLAKDIPGKFESQINKDLLLSNHDVSEIAFDIDKQNNIGCFKEFPNVMMDYAGEESGFNAFSYCISSIKTSIQYFIEEIAPKYNLKVTGFQDMIKIIMKSS